MGTGKERPRESNKAGDIEKGETKREGGKAKKNKGKLRLRKNRELKRGREKERKTKRK